MAGDTATTLAEYLEGNARMQGFGNPQFQGQLLQFLNDNPYGVGVKSLDRDPQQQAVLWQQALAKYGSPEVARKWVAPPGHSNHGRGVAADISFEDDQARQWAHANAGNYGLTFPLSNEAWHVEPVGARGGDAPSPGVQVASGGVAQQFVDPRKPTGTLAEALPGATLPGAAPVMPVAAGPDPATVAMMNVGQGLQQKQEADAKAEQSRRQALFGRPRGGVAGLFA
jgi:hypothetical protein